MLTVFEINGFALIVNNNSFQTQGETKTDWNETVQGNPPVSLDSKTAVKRSHSLRRKKWKEYCFSSVGLVALHSTPFMI